MSKVQILRYGGSTEAQQVGCFLWDKSVIYGAYDTKDKRVKLLLEPDAEPVSPFPTREALLEAAATGGRDEPAPPRAKGEARARGAPAASSGSDRNSPLIEL